MGKLSPTFLTIRKLREEGYTAQNVERYNSFSGKKQDLFNFIDIVAVHPKRTGVVGVQTTSKANISTRIKKIESSPEHRVWLSAKNRIIVHGWYKDKNKWQVVEREIK